MRTPRSDMKSKRARRAIEYLFDKLSEYPEHASTIIAHVRSYSIRHRTPIIARERMLYCDTCSKAYTSASKRRVRAQSLYIHCEHCGALRRLRAPTHTTKSRPSRRKAAKA